MRMRENRIESLESRLMDTRQLCVYTNMGRNSAMKLGNEIGARVQVGSRVLWDKKKIDNYIDEITGNCEGEKRHKNL